MHMADALLSPAVGATMWALSAATLGRSATQVRRTMDEGRLPLMGVLGAFVFAIQMLNFAIPGTGSSGHLAGTLFLALLLGPHAAFLTVSSVLVVQALFFADGGLLALGCNIFNIGFFPAFVAYPFIVRPLLAGNPGQGRRAFGILLGAVLGLQFGAFGVVLETVISGRTALPFKAFLYAMQPIHLAIGLVEGLATLALVGFLARTRPELLETQPRSRSAWKGALVVAVMALVAGGCLSWFASQRPDGLEWALAKVGQHEAEAPVESLHGRFAQAQAQTALMPDYAFKSGGESRGATSLAGVGGGVLTLLIVGGVGIALRPRRKMA